ncbi:hypothetical protein M9H77_29699 [Catharanthus roseus]|uniref:Uncharacterized protein n=1 Tax=Catharanthus roseus TaxID=4058 RepID=A0ACB9ZV56_CATRO|nr:hypothetical protein M9H77_29699 [Catharanthus roseus]
MVEVPTHMHPSLIVPNVLMRHHEHRSRLIWSHMLPGFSGSLNHVRYINLLEDFEAINTYSCHVQLDPLAPFGAMWCTSFDLSQLLVHVLLTYRDQLEFMPSDQSVCMAAIS